MINQRYGGLKIIWHPEKLKAMLEGRVTAPVYVRVKPTNKCNHRCSFCSYDPSEGDVAVRDDMKDRKDEIPKPKMLEILADFKDMGVKAVTFSGGGEPLIYPHIIQTIEQTLEYGLKLSIITNGQNLTGRKAEILANANWVRVSANASTPQTFARIRKVPEPWFYQLGENIAKFSKIKSPTTELGINFVVCQENAEEVFQSVKYFKELGVNHIKITPMWTTDFLAYHAKTKDSVEEQIAHAKELTEKGFEVYETYKQDFSRSSVAERTYDRCYVMQVNPAIGANQIVYFCHDKAYSSTGALGSIKDQSFKDLWFSEEAKKMFASFNPQEGCKHHCAGDSKNITINSAMECYGNDIDFV